MASLHELLAEEGFERGKFIKSQRQVKYRDKSMTDDSIVLPIYICHDRKKLDFPKHRAEKRNNLRRGSLDSRGSVNSPSVRDEPAIDEVAIRAVVSILSGYIGRYLKDESFRNAIRKKYHSCLTAQDEEESENAILVNMELGIESVEKLVEIPGTMKQARMKPVLNSIRLLSVVASLNSKSSRNGMTCGTPNLHLCACAQLYLAIVYKLEKNDRASARHLLQLFCDSPRLGRTHLLPDLWEHFFLPHLLHIKIWYSKEVEFLQNSDFIDKGRKMKALSKVYNEHMDMGTTQFADYYQEWLKAGAQPSPLPSLPLPARPHGCRSSRRRSSESFASHSSINRSLYQAVFGSIPLERRSMDIDEKKRGFIEPWTWSNIEEEEKACTHDQDNIKQLQGYAEQRTMAKRRTSSQCFRDHKTLLWPETQKSGNNWLLTCKIEPREYLVHGSQIASNDSPMGLPPSELSTAITAICSSESLADCEVGIRVITKTWLDSNGDPTVEKKLSKAPVIEGMLELLYTSDDEEIIELTISVLAELVLRNEENRHVILISDPQLDIFLRLLRSSSLFLKAAVLLYLVKPKAKQMISMEWVPLVLRVLEFGDHLQTLLAVQCSPQLAAYYLFDQILTGFDEDKNLENARQVVSIGGLSLLAKRMENGDVCEKIKAASIIVCCIRADGSCRHYLANNLNKGSILELLVQGMQRDSLWHALALLTELLCLNRRTQATRILDELLNGWGNLNTMHILFVYLQKARTEERPIVAAIILQLDLMGDPLKCSVYRNEVVEVIIEVLDCHMCDEKVQEQSAKALSILGGRFSYSGEPTVDKWLLKEAGFDESSEDSFRGKDIVAAELMHLNNEDSVMQDWQRKAAMVLLTSGNKRLLAVLSDSIAKGIPCLARASLVTVSWMSIYLHSIGDENLPSEACSIFVPRLIECLSYSRALEERVLASFTLLTLTKSSDCLCKISLVDKGLMGHLQNLSQVTWTANELISVITSSSRRPRLHPDNEIGSD